MDKPERAPDIDNCETKYWHSITPITNFSDRQMICYFLCKCVLPAVNSLQSIANSDEAYINVGCGRFVLFVCTGGPDGPDEVRLTALEIGSGQSPIVRQGIWHWTP